VSQNVSQISTPTKGKKTSSLKERVCEDTYFTIGFCIFLICLTMIIIVNEISLRLTLTATSTGNIIAVRGQSRQHMVVIHYVNGVQYVGRLRGLSRGSSDIRREGRQIQIFYNPSAPQQIRINATGASDIFATIIFVIVISFFIVLLIAKIKNEWV